MGRDLAMSIEDADVLFTKEGFWRQIFPRMIVVYFLFGGIGVVVVGGSSAWNAVLTVALTCLALTGAQLYALRRSARQHASLKQKYGSRYTEIIELGLVQLSPMRILMSDPLGLSAEKILEERNSGRK